MERTIQLQGIGKVAAAPASMLKVGSVITCNFGYKEIVTAILKETLKTLVVQVQMLNDGKIEDKKYIRRWNKSTLLAIEGDAE